MNNRGSVVIEMCLIAPILVGVMFVVINVLILAMNTGIAEGEMYSVLYNKEEYYMSVDGEGDTDMAASVLVQHLNNGMCMVDNVSVDACMKENKSAVLSGAAVKGNWNIQVSYKEDTPGVQMLINDGVVQKMVAVSQEIRNTASNLRRWQAYGELLSD